MELFGFEFRKKQQIDDEVDSSIKLPIEENDGTTVVSAGTMNVYSTSIDPTWKSERDLIVYYRDMAVNHNVDRAIEEIVSDAIVIDTDMPVKIDFAEDSSLSKPIKKKIAAEFDTIMNLLDFKEDGHSIFRDWYIEGRLGYFKVVDPKRTQLGILELQKLDVANLKKVRKIKTKKEGNVEVIDEIDDYFVYASQDDTGGMARYMYNKKEMQIKEEAVAYITSGLLDKNRNWVISYLHKAIRPANHLRLLEDAALIYDLVRAPERRVFYIDVGDMPRNRAEEYLRDVMNKYRNKVTYDAQTGDVKSDKRAMAMLEDYWLPRKGGSSSTEISTLPGGQSQSTDKIDYFKKNLYEALNIPLGRLESSSGFSLGRSSEITRDEVKFSSFIAKLRNRFSGLFLDLLRTQLILKNIVTPQDWEDIVHEIEIVFESNVLFAEMKESEMLQSRLQTMQQIDPYVGNYFSKKWVQKNVLKFSDEDIERMKAEIEEEIAAGEIPDPNSPPPQEDGQDGQPQQDNDGQPDQQEQPPEDQQQQLSGYEPAQQ